MTAVSSSTASSTSISRFGSPNSEGVLTSVARTLAAPVENVGPRGGDRVACVAAPRRMAVRRHRVDDQPACNNGVDRGERDHGQADASACLGVTVGLSVEQRAQHTAAPRLGWSGRSGRDDFGRGDIAHRG